MVAVADTTMAAAEYALRGLQQRADVRAHNVANHATPGFRAMRVDFETALASAVARGGPPAAPSVQPAMSLPDVHNNTVNLESEIVGMMKDNLQRDAMVNAYNAKTGMLRVAIQGR
jgi:flagellar basal-body rod protein FlgB